MNAREERGLIIAACCKLNKTPDGWLVPSQTSAMIYRVNVESQTCTCPDHLEAGFKCKHHAFQRGVVSDYLTDSCADRQM